MAEFNVGAVNYKKKKRVIETVFTNMHSQYHDESKGGILFAGDSGVGKTSFVRDMAKLLGLPIVIIETPHITEEHIVNIPFIVSNPLISPSDTKMTVKSDSKKTYHIELADSNLYTQISKQKRVEDAEYLKAIHSDSTPDDVRKIFETFGGSTTEIPAEIKTLRNRYRCILFLDEYFRQTSPTIQNMLRTILNGHLGELHKLPKDLFVIYASNLIDEGVGQIPGQVQMRSIYFGTEGENNGQTVDYEITNDDWFGYLVSKFKKDKKVQLDKKVVDAFYTLFTKESKKIHLSVNDLASDVRTSPRRWEQVLLYVNSSLPVKDEKEAKSLMTNVKNAFGKVDNNDENEPYKQSSITDLVLKTVKDLIESTSNIKVGADKFNDDTQWRDTLEHQIQTAIKMGHHRKYVPVVSGTPGIAKTTFLKQIAIDLLMIPVIFDVSHVSAESVLGLPVPHEKDKSIETEFSVPVLYQAMMKQIEDGEKALFAALKHELPTEKATEKIKEYKGKEYKYVLFFDELNRAHSAKVFNAMRRVLLERSFGEDAHGKDLALPEGSIIVAAINPTGLNTIPFTRHIQDVLDIIPAGASWKDFGKVLDDVKFGADENGDKPDKDQISLARSAMKAFIDRFAAREKKFKSNDKEFYLDTGDEDYFYVAPREYQAILVDSARNLHRTYKEVVKNLDGDEKNPELLAEADEDLRDAIYRAYRHTLSTVTEHRDAAPKPELWSKWNKWFMSSTDFDVLDALKQSVDKMPLAEILDRIYDKSNQNLFDDIDFINYIKNGDAQGQEFAKELEDYLTQKLDHASVLTDKVLPMKKMVDRTVAIEDAMVSKFEFLLREIIHSIKIHNLSRHALDMVKHSFLQFKIHVLTNGPKGVDVKHFASFDKVMDHVLQIVPAKYHNQIMIGNSTGVFVGTKAAKVDGKWAFDRGDVRIFSNKNTVYDHLKDKKDIDELKSFDDRGSLNNFEIALDTGSGFDSFGTFNDAIRHAMFSTIVMRLSKMITELIKEVIK